MNESFLKELFSNARPVTKLVFALFIMFTSYLLVTFFTILIAIAIYPLSFEELNILLKEGLLKADLSLLRLFQISQSIGLFIVPSVLLNFLLFRSGDGFILRSAKSYSMIFWVVLLTLLASIPLTNILLEWNSALQLPEWVVSLEDKLQQMEFERTQLTHRMTENMQFSDYFFNVLMISVLPAIGEEFFFRGVVQKVFFQWTRNGHISIFIAAIVFSSIHLQFYGFLPRLLLGMYFGYLFFWSHNIWIAVWAHFLNNFIAISFIFLAGSKWVQMPDFLTNNSYNGYVVVVSSIILSGALILISQQYIKKSKEQKII